MTSVESCRWPVGLLHRLVGTRQLLPPTGGSTIPLRVPSSSGVRTPEPETDTLTLNPTLTLTLTLHLNLNLNLNLRCGLEVARGPAFFQYLRKRYGTSIVVCRHRGRSCFFPPTICVLLLWLSNVQEQSKQYNAIIHTQSLNIISAFKLVVFVRHRPPIWVATARIFAWTPPITNALPGGRSWLIGGGNE